MKKMNLKRGPDTYHRIPKVKSNIRIFWADKNGTIKHNNLKGKWVPGRITALEWPEGEAMPGVYMCDISGRNYRVLPNEYVRRPEGGQDMQDGRSCKMST